MGQSLSQTVEKNSDDKSKLLEIERTMRDRLECKKARLYIDALNDECIPIVCAVDKFDEFLGEVFEDESRLESEIEKILKKHLRSQDDAAFEKLAKLLTEVLWAMVQSETHTHEEHQTHVVHANESFIRIDYFLYFERYKGKKAALCYYGQVGLMDVSKARLPVLIYELRRTTSEDKLKKAGDELDRLGDLKLHSVKDAVEFLRLDKPTRNPGSAPT